MLRAGAEKVSINSAAVARPELIDESAHYFGSQCTVLAVDTKWNGDFYEVYVNGGRKATGKETVAWVREGVRRGAGEVVVNSIDADGTKHGYELRITRMVADSVDV